jgi:hypothetical protein
MEALEDGDIEETVFAIHDLLAHVRELDPRAHDVDHVFELVRPVIAVHDCPTNAECSVVLCYRFLDDLQFIYKPVVFDASDFGEFVDERLYTCIVLLYVPVKLNERYLEEQNLDMAFLGHDFGGVVVCLNQPV